MVGWNDQVTATAQLISAGVENMISRITSHGYSSNPTLPVKTTRPTWMSEKETTDAWNGNWYVNGAVSEGFTWATLMYTAIVDAGVSAYLYWEGIEVTTNNAGLIQISGTTVNPLWKTLGLCTMEPICSPWYRSCWHLWRTFSAQTRALKNTDGSVSVQMLNAGSGSQAVTVTTTGFTATGAKACLTNQSNNGVNSMSVSLSATIPSYSMMTFILTGGTSSGGVAVRPLPQLQPLHPILPLLHRAAVAVVRQLTTHSAVGVVTLAQLSAQLLIPASTRILSTASVFKCVVMRLKVQW
jgi:hypothetical protein